MTGEVCPKCRVAVVPGYVKCPKCHAPLPRHARPTLDPGGGTAVNEPARFPVGLAIVAAVVVCGGLVAYFALHGHHAARAVAATDQGSATASAASATGSTGATDDSDDSDDIGVPPPPAAGRQATAPMPADAVAARLERRLKHLHLWATVDVGSTIVDVRSDSCGDPAIKPVIDSAAPRFKAAGLTRLRCLEESGTVVFTRDL